MQRLKENVDFMVKSHLDKALQNKRKDLNFFPVLYFEGMDTNDVKKRFYNYSDGIILASPEYYNVSDLQHNLNVFSKVFSNKPIKYVIYTTRTSSLLLSKVIVPHQTVSSLPPCPLQTRHLALTE